MNYTGVDPKQIYIGILGSIGIPGNFEGEGTNGTIPGILRNIYERLDIYIGIPGSIRILGNFADMGTNGTIPGILGNL